MPEKELVKKPEKELVIVSFRIPKKLYAQFEKKIEPTGIKKMVAFKKLIEKFVHEP